MEQGNFKEVSMRIMPALFEDGDVGTLQLIGAEDQPLYGFCILMAHTYHFKAVPVDQTVKLMTGRVSINGVTFFPGDNILIEADTPTEVTVFEVSSWWTMFERPIKPKSAPESGGEHET